MPSITDVKCILVIGSTAGIGRALALNILALPTKPTVIVAGRRQERLDEIVKAENKDGRLCSVRFDVNADRATLKKSVDEVVKQYPELDAVMFASGVQQEFDFTKPESVDLDKIAEELNTNYTSIVNMTTFFLPHFIQLSSSGRPSFIYAITSSLSIVSGPWVPCYCASKAALRSFCQSINVALKDKNVHVVEILPPLVESELHDHQGKRDALSKSWMPLDEFTEKTMAGLQSGAAEIPIGQAETYHKQFETGKLEAVAKQYEQRKAAEKGN